MSTESLCLCFSTLNSLGLSSRISCRSFCITAATTSAFAAAAAATAAFAAAAAADATASAATAAHTAAAADAAFCFGRFSELDMDLKARVCGGDGLQP